MGRPASMLFSGISNEPIANVYAELNAFDIDFECCRISRTARSHLDGVQCARRGMRVPFFLHLHIFDNWVPRQACVF